MQVICTAADDRHDPVRVCFTLRDDFLGRMAEGPEAREVLSRLAVLRSPGMAALFQILTKPVAAVGYAYDDPELVNDMIAAVRGEPACLPLLQFATRMLWERRDRTRRVLRRADYDAIGGVAGALAVHADGVLEGLSEAELKLARELMLRLVTADGTRRVLLRTRILEEEARHRRAAEVADAPHAGAPGHRASLAQRDAVRRRAAGRLRAPTVQVA